MTNTPLEIDKHSNPKKWRLTKGTPCKKNCGHGVLRSSFFHSSVINYDFPVPNCRGVASINIEKQSYGR